MGVLDERIALLVALAMLAVKIYAFVNALVFSAESYVAAGKLTKPGWSIGLGLGVVLQLIWAGSLLNLAFTIAAIVFLVDVRPALAGLRRR